MLSDTARHIPGMDVDRLLEALEVLREVLPEKEWIGVVVQLDNALGPYMYTDGVPFVPGPRRPFRK
jgi:hypothetical protein